MWESCGFTKSEINLAGRKIIAKNISSEERNECLKVINSWRRAHAYPMNTFAINLRHIVNNIDGAVVVQRLKRLKTIEDKLVRFPEMELYRMQDLGGCRVIVPSVEDVYTVVREWSSQESAIKKQSPRITYRRRIPIRVTEDITLYISIIVSGIQSSMACELKSR